MKTYKLNQNTNKMILGAAILILCMMYLFFKQTGRINPVLIAPLIVLVLRYFWQKSHNALIINANHLEFSVTPLQSKRFIKYNDVQDMLFDERKKKIVFTTKASKNIKLSLKEFHKNDRADIKKTLLQNIPNTII